MQTGQTHGIFIVLKNTQSTCLACKLDPACIPPSPLLSQICPESLNLGAGGAQREVLAHPVFTPIQGAK
ncbi:proteophosphoglycan ppg4 [Moniliophthora roreri]|nr:proteophosphoglycan ppg4 [Moniliophthora roreri]